ncbi:MAG: hypothetical protein JW741_20225 [Sedimentisphaerales bacterium]|nr:hypothetical protein [Sedimentisphaerales bacterium]
MLSTIIGLFFILFGIVFLLYPESLRKRLRKKALRKLRRYFFGAALGTGIMLISLGWRYAGVLPKILAVAGAVAVLKGLLLLKSRAAEEATQWILRQPVLTLRIFAGAQIGLGLLILFGLKG